MLSFSRVSLFGSLRKRRKTKAIKGGQFHLPEPIIHRIQSFLTGKEAARTAILSKPWHSAWLSRPDLDFDEGYFLDSSDEESGSSDEENDFPDEENDSFDYHIYSSDEDRDSSDDHSDSCDVHSHRFGKFLKFGRKTIRRYEQTNLKIERLRLCIRRPYSFSNDANDLVVRALKIGATHISFETQSPTNSALPHEVFESGNLVDLSAEGCKIKLKMDQKVICSKLESLCLIKVRIKSEILNKIISSCPLIKTLSLFDVSDFRYRKVSIDFPELHELTCLELCNVKFEGVFLADLSSKFPNLKDLMLLGNCGDVLEICSRSLERLTILAEEDEFLEAEFELPSIQKFTFQGSDFPSMLSFKSTSREWESHVLINDKEDLLSTLWFSGLKKFLTQLRRSKIYLSLNLYSGKSFNYEPQDIFGLPKHQVENVTMYFRHLPSLSCYALFDGLFRLCRPKFVTHSLHHDEFSNVEGTNNNFLCKTLLRGMNGEFSSPSSFMHGLHDLEEANMELYVQNVAAWRPRPLESLLDGSITTFPKVVRNVRFRLKWKP